MNDFQIYDYKKYGKISFWFSTVCASGTRRDIENAYSDPCFFRTSGGGRDFSINNFTHDEKFERSLLWFAV